MYLYEIKDFSFYFDKENGCTFAVPQLHNIHTNEKFCNKIESLNLVYSAALKIKKEMTKLMNVVSKAKEKEQQLSLFE